MVSPETSYLDRDGTSLAFQVIGDGPADVLLFMEVNSHLDLIWSDPHLHEALEGAAPYIRLAMLQMRGIGLSETTAYIPTLEQQASDLLAVMDAVGMERVVIASMFGLCGAAAMVAAREPSRVKELVLINPFAQGLASAARPVGWTADEMAAFELGYREAFDRWGTGATVDMWDYVLATPYNRRLFALNERCSASPAKAMAYWDWLMHTDLTEICRAVQVPTRVLRKPSSPIPIAVTRHFVDLIPNATLHVMAPTLPGASFGESYAPMIDEIMEATTGSVMPTDANRLLRTVLFTDVVSSTDLLAELGDKRYGELRAAHERLVRLHVEAECGELVNVIGDGTFSVFDGPVQALRAACRIRDSASELGLDVRAGSHAGEIERSGIDFHGMTVHIGARVSSKAGAGEILVTQTVRDLVAGSGLRFSPCGSHALKGVPGAWELFRLDVAADQDGTVPIQRTEATILDRFTLQAARRLPKVNRAIVRIGNARERRKSTPPESSASRSAAE
ncbi:MAG TPA: adenylate/guanylate cyclase domain-containing protein [Mycobacteriales bacterium]|nr:adenylate/guanylate cyclase domain-containing protein [Mycobacteriales bacterium]